MMKRSDAFQSKLSAWFPLPFPQRRWLQYALVGLWLLGLAVALMPSAYIDPGFEVSDKLQHGLAFFLFAGLLDMATQRSFWRFQWPLLLGYGALIEVLQAFLPWRMFSLLDFAADAAGVLVYWLLFRYVLGVKCLPPMATR